MQIMVAKTVPKKTTFKQCSFDIIRSFRTVPKINCGEKIHFESIYSSAVTPLDDVEEKKMTALVDNLWWDCLSTISWSVFTSHHFLDLHGKGSRHWGTLPSGNNSNIMQADIGFLGVFRKQYSSISHCSRVISDFHTGMKPKSALHGAA